MSHRFVKNVAFYPCSVLNNFKTTMHPLFIPGNSPRLLHKYNEQKGQEWKKLIVVKTAELTHATEETRSASHSERTCSTRREAKADSSVIVVP